MRYLGNMKLLMKYSEMSLEELFKEYIRVQPDSEGLYYPDMFIKDIHRAYLEDNKVSLPNPIYGTWDIIQECNLRCLFCSAAAPKTGDEYISNPLAVQIADRIIESGIKYISIRGGEPTICRELTEVVKKFIKAGIFVEIVTNGRHIEQKFFDELRGIPYSLLRIKISFDSVNEEVNDYQRGNKSYFYAVRAMECCKRNSMPFRIQMVLTNKNYRDIKETYKFCEKKGATSFGCMILIAVGRGKNSSLKISLNREILLQLLDIINHETQTIVEKIGLGADVIRLYKPLMEEMNFLQKDAVISGHIKCNGYKTRIYIASNGDVFPCDMLQYDEFKSGNILYERDFWHSNNAERFRLRNRANVHKCKDCKVYGCNMGCMAISLENSPNKNMPIPNCEV